MWRRLSAVAQGPLTMRGRRFRAPPVNGARAASDKKRPRRSRIASGLSGAEMVSRVWL